MATSVTHTQQFALKWNNFHSNLSSGFHELFEAADMVDVTLAMDGKFLQAHKVVLSICSPYFKEMFKVNPCKHPIVILKGVGHEHMKDILEFMYLGEVSVLRENLTSFLRTAELLQVKGLTGDESSEASSKEDEKFDCYNNDDGEYTNIMPNNMQYNQQYNSMENLIGITSQYSPTVTTNNPSSPQSVQLPLPSVTVPSTNNKRSKISTSNGSNGKRSKTDNNGNQSTSSTSLPISLIKTEDDSLSQMKKRVSLIQESESEFTDLSNIKSDRSSIDEESVEKQVESRSNSLVEGYVDQGKPDAKYALKPSYLCEVCPKRFSRRDHLRTHEKNIHGEDAGPFVCIVCSQLYKNTESLRKHISKFHVAPKSESLIFNSAKA